MSDQVKVGSVVQIDPDARDCLVPGCFAIVTEVKSWGVVAWVTYPPRQRGDLSEAISIRLENGSFAVVGDAPWGK